MNTDPPYFTSALVNFINVTAGQTFNYELPHSLDPYNGTVKTSFNFGVTSQFIKVNGVTSLIFFPSISNIGTFQIGITLSCSDRLSLYQIQIIVNQQSIS